MLRVSTNCAATTYRKIRAAPARVKFQVRKVAFFESSYQGPSGPAPWGVSLEMNVSSMGEGALPERGWAVRCKPAHKVFWGSLVLHTSEKEI